MLPSTNNITDRQRQKYPLSPDTVRTSISRAKQEENQQICFCDHKVLHLEPVTMSVNYLVVGCMLATTVTGLYPCQKCPHTGSDMTRGSLKTAKKG